MLEAGVKTFDGFDYVIVGAGTAGCVLANRLSADPELNVLLLEAGGRDDYFWIKIPVGYLFTMGNPRTDWCFQTEPEPGLNGRVLAYPRGRTLGGCSAINGMIYMRGQARDYDQWRQMGNTGWGWDDVLPVFRASEDFVGGESDMHGAEGEWRVEDQRLTWEILDSFREACAEIGIPKTEDFNRGTNEGAGYFHVNQKRGVRWSAAHAFLHPVTHRKNLTVLTQAQAKRLTVVEGRVTGVDFWLDGADAHAGAKCEVVLASGSVGSPQILQLSGIGPGALLRDHGVDVTHELPGVGENLQDHLQIRAVYKVQNAKHPQRAGQQPDRQGGDGSGISVVPARADDHGAKSAWRVHKIRRQPRDAEFAISCPAAVARQVRRTATPVPGDHRVGVQSAPRQPRPYPHQQP